MHASELRRRRRGKKSLESRSKKCTTTPFKYKGGTTRIGSDNYELAKAAIFSLNKHHSGVSARQNRPPYQRDRSERARGKLHGAELGGEEGNDREGQQRTAAAAQSSISPCACMPRPSLASAACFHPHVLRLFALIRSLARGPFTLCGVDFVSGFLVGR